MILWYSDHSPWCFLIWTVTLEALGENYMFLCKLVSIDWVVLTAQCETVIVQLNIWKLQHTVENKTFPWTVITPLNNTHTQAQIKERMGFDFVSSVTPVTCLNTFEACSLCVPWRLATISQLISIPLPQHPPKKKPQKVKTKKPACFSLGHLCQLEQDCSIGMGASQKLEKRNTHSPMHLIHTSYFHKCLSSKEDGENK